MAMLMKI